MALTLFVNMLTGNEFDSDLASILNGIHIEKIHLTPALTTIAQALVSFGQFLAEHPLYEVLFWVLFMVCCVRVAFRRVGGYNFVETFIFMVFLICQIYICKLFATPIQSLFEFAETQLLSSSSPVMVNVGSLVSAIGVFISAAFTVFMTFLYVLDFRQFFGLSWKKTILRMLFAGFVAIMALFIIILIAAVTYKKGVLWGGCLSVLTIVLLGTYAIASEYLHKNKPLVNSVIYYSSKLLSYSLLVSAPFVAHDVNKNGGGELNIWIFSLVTLACTVLAGTIAFLPSYLYKRYRNHN
jgi:hypothetical protein